MLLELKDTPNTMVGFRVSGEDTQDEFYKIVLPAVQELILRTGKLNCLFILDQPADFSFGTWLQNSMIETNNTDKWNRVAIVTASGSSIQMGKVFHTIVPGELKIFSNDEVGEAIVWVSEQTSLSKQMVYQEEDDGRD